MYNSFITQLYEDLAVVSCWWRLLTSFFKRSWILLESHVFLFVLQAASYTHSALCCSLLDTETLIWYASVHVLVLPWKTDVATWAFVYCKIWTKRYSQGQVTLQQKRWAWVAPDGRQTGDLMAGDCNLARACLINLLDLQYMFDATRY